MREYDFSHIPIVLEDGTTKIVTPEQPSDGDASPEEVEEEVDETKTPTTPGDILKEKERGVNLVILVSFTVMVVVLLGLLLRAIINYFKHKNATYISQSNKKTRDDLTKEEGIAMTVTVGKGDDINEMRQTQLAKEGNNPFKQMQYDYKPDYAVINMNPSYTSSRGFSRPSELNNPTTDDASMHHASNAKMKEVEEEIVDVGELGPG